MNQSVLNGIAGAAVVLLLPFFVRKYVPAKAKYGRKKIWLTGVLIAVVFFVLMRVMVALFPNTHGLSFWQVAIIIDLVLFVLFNSFMLGDYLRDKRQNKLKDRVDL